MKKLLLGSFLAALALFIWGFIYYGFSGIPYKFLGDAGDVGPVLKASFPADGTYVIPDPTAENMQELQKSGPIATVHIKRNGVENPMSMMGKGFIHGWIYCLLLAGLLKKISSDKGYCSRVCFITMVATAGAFVSRFGDAIWWHQAWGWQAANFAYSVVGGIIIGAILGKFISAEKS